LFHLEYERGNFVSCIYSSDVQKKNVYTLPRGLGLKPHSTQAHHVLYAPNQESLLWRGHGCPVLLLHWRFPSISASSLLNETLILLSWRIADLNSDTLSLLSSPFSWQLRANFYVHHVIYWAAAKFC
jgi:hypothetical protein